MSGYSTVRIGIRIITFMRKKRKEKICLVIILPCVRVCEVALKAWPLVALYIFEILVEGQE